MFCRQSAVAPSEFEVPDDHQAGIIVPVHYLLHPLKEKNAMLENFLIGVDIFSGEKRDLPVNAYVTFTEAVTWIATGDSRNDQHVGHLWDELSCYYSREWGNANGPAWLKPHIELLREGRTWDDVENDAALNERKFREDQFQRAQQWCEDKKFKPANALTKIAEWRDHHLNDIDKIEAAEEFLFDNCAGEIIKIFGVRKDKEQELSDGVHAPILHTFFLGRVHFRRLYEFLNEGELTPFGDPSIYNNFNTEDRRPEYRQVRIKRDDVIRLKRSWEEKNAGVIQSSNETSFFEPVRQHDRNGKNRMKLGRPSDQMNNAIKALQAIYPSDIPYGLKRSALHAEVNEWLTQQGLPIVSIDTVDRARQRLKKT